MYDLDIISVTYKQEHPLKCFVESILSQTKDSWKLHILHDGPGPDFIRIMNNYWGDPRINYFCTEERYNDYGHSLRKLGIKELGNSRYTLITNVDNYYTPVFLQEMCSYDTDVVYCQFVHSHWNYTTRPTEMGRGKIDCGCFIVKTDIVKEVGWNSTNYHADWEFLQDCLKYNSKLSVRRVEKILFVHN